MDQSAASVGIVGVDSAEDAWQDASGSDCSFSSHSVPDERVTDPLVVAVLVDGVSIELNELRKPVIFGNLLITISSLRFLSSAAFLFWAPLA